MAIMQEKQQENVFEIEYDIYSILKYNNHEYLENYLWIWVIFVEL